MGQQRSFDDSSLWRVSAFERFERDTGSSGYARLDGPTVLPTTLVADLRHHDTDAARGDVLEIVAACLRHRESALLYLRHDGLVWPITLFPAADLYHAPHPLQPGGATGLADVALLAIEPPALRPPGHYQRERVGRDDLYRPLAPLLWQLALHGPRERLLAEVGGSAAYRATGSVQGAGLSAPGALASALERLRRETASLREIATWPGVGVERGARLLNALYLTRSLMVMRSHPAARPEPVDRTPRRGLR